MRESEVVAEEPRLEETVFKNLSIFVDLLEVTACLCFVGVRSHILIPALRNPLAGCETLDASLDGRIDEGSLSFLGFSLIFRWSEEQKDDICALQNACKFVHGVVRLSPSHGGVALLDWGILDSEQGQLRQ